MKRVYVGILSSHGEPYDAFKKVWLRNIEHTNNFEPRYKGEVKYDFYFIYGGDSEDVIHHSGYTDLYYVYPETIPNMLRKTLKFFEHINNTTKTKDEVFILRTNLSTLFDFRMYQEWLKNVHSQTFFGGSIIYGFQGETTTFSGTNMIMSRDTMQFVLLRQDRFSYNYNEDVELSHMVMLNMKCKIKAMKRLDFLSDNLVYHKCRLYAEDISCYRFKSSDRKQDVNMMHNILACLQAGVNIIRFIQTQFKHFQVSSEASDIEMLSEHTWMVKGNKYIKENENSLK